MTTETELRALLSPDEIRYAPIAARLGPDAVPALRVLAADEDTLLASKAVYLASLLDGAQDVVQEAAGSDDLVIRSAAASAVANLGGATRTRVATILLETEDAAVQKVTLRNLGPDLPAPLQDRVRQIARTSTHDTVRDLAAQRLAD